MVWVIKKGASKKEIEAIEQEFSQKSNAGFDPQKHCDTVKIKSDALKIQKKLRKEWERS